MRGRWIVANAGISSRRSCLQSCGILSHLCMSDYGNCIRHQSVGFPARPAGASKRRTTADVVTQVDCKRDGLERPSYAKTAAGGPTGGGR